MSFCSYRKALALCPFYKRDDGKARIVCEGLIDKSSIVLTYGAKSDYETQADTFCCADYKCCEVYKLLLKKYEE